MIRVNDIYPAIQGEGVMAGTPMILIRLQGCSVGCPWCDTKETWVNDPENCVPLLSQAMGTNARWNLAEPVLIAAEARAMSPTIRWALLTGGEPAEQELEPLCDALHGQGFMVALETSGTAPIKNPHVIDWICVSPKFKMPGGKRVLPEVMNHADELKQVIGTTEDLAILDLFFHDVPHQTDCQISLQPVSQAFKATQLCIKTCLDRGWRLSLQLHKYIHAR